MALLVANALFQIVTDAISLILVNVSVVFLDGFLMSTQEGVLCVLLLV